jgi:glycosyl transferase family 25
MRIYYINVARRTDRRDFMEAQFARLGLKATRIEAISPDTLPDAAKIRSAGRLQPAALSCSLSHVLAAKSLLASGDPAGLIFEDDAVLSSHLPEFLKALDAQLPEFDALRIEASSRGLRLKTAALALGSIELMRPYSWEGGAAGYVLSRRGAQLMAASDVLTYQLPDMALFQPFGPLGRRLALYQACPALCIQSHLRKTATFAGFGSDLPYGVPKPATPPSLGKRLGDAIADIGNVLHRELVLGSQRTLHQLLGAKKRVIPFLE